MSGGRTAAKIGNEVVKYYVKKPFLSTEGKKKAKTELNEKGADILFKGLSLLKGTALKMAQVLSLELDIFPESVRKELEKSYNQVPPINRALVRTIIRNNLNAEPEKIFRSFDLKAFAAASLGQVHYAESETGEKLAVKIQYPDIRRTIASDIQLIKMALKPWSEYDQALPALDEVEEMLTLETDYHSEAGHAEFFLTRLDHDRVKIPRVHTGVSTDTILTLSYLDGKPLNEWLKTKPRSDQIDQVAQVLHDVFLVGLYDLNCIHADPNPGNFIVFPDLTVGLIDFGCVKYFDPEFVDYYRQLPRVARQGDRDEHIELMKRLKIIRPDLDRETEDEILTLFHQIGQWFCRLYQEEYFDFCEHGDFILQGKQLMNQAYKLRQNFQEMNPNFVFLDRTRYGLLRLFERMKARVRIRNHHEWE